MLDFIHGIVARKNSGIWAGALVAVPLLMGASPVAMAGNIPITNGDFQSPLDPYYPYGYHPVVSGWINGSLDNDGTCLTQYYAPELLPVQLLAEPTVTQPQVAYINEYIAQQLSGVTLDPSATYTVNLYVHGSIKVELLDGSPTGAPIAPVVSLSDTSATAQTAVFTPNAGTAGDPVYLVLASPGGQNYATLVTASQSVPTPEPASLMLLGIGACGMLARRRRA